MKKREALNLIVVCIVFLAGAALSMWITGEVFLWWIGR